MGCADIINIIALVAAPIIAVWVSVHLQNRTDKRKDKMDVFKAVMTFRYGWTREGVEALNNIPLVFSKDEAVRKRWREYYNYLCIQDPDPMEMQQRQTALHKLLESMASSLGYKETITWEDIQNPYVPVGMINAMNNSDIIQSGMANIVQIMSATAASQQSGDSDDAQINQ